MKTLVLLPLVIVFGCSDRAATPAAVDSGQTDGSPTDDAHVDQTMPDSATDSAVCNTLDLTGVAAVTLTQVAGDAPSAAGGTVADGTYLLTKYTLYTGPGGPTGSLPLSVKARRQFSAGVVQTIQADGDGSNVVRFTATFSAATSNFTEMHTCGGTAVDRGTYSATSSTLIEWTTDRGMVVEATFTMQ